MANFADEIEVMGTAIALGAEIPAVPGSTVYELQSFGGSYDEYHERVLGLYASQKDATNAMRKTFYEVYSMEITNAPWGKRLEKEVKDKVLSPQEWYVAKQKWFESHTLKYIAGWFEKKADFWDDPYYGHYSLRIVKRNVALSQSKYVYSLPSAD